MTPRELKMMFRHHKMMFLIVGAVCLSFVCPQIGEAAPPAPGKVDTKVSGAQAFTYKYKAGETTRYSNVISQSMNMKGQGGPMGNQNVKTKMVSALKMNTKKVMPNGDAQIVTTYDSFEMSMEQGSQTIKGQQLGPISEMMKKLITTSVVSPTGKQKSLSFEGLPPEMNQLKDSFKNALIGATPEFPSKGLKVGENWSQTVPMDFKQGNINLKMKFTVKYTFLGFTQVDKTKTAVFKSELDITMEKTTSTMMGMSMTIGGNGKGNGFLYFDPSLGRLHKSDMEMVQNIDMSIKGPEGPQSLKMDMTTNVAMAVK
jgi:hypothetical protein